jgi:arylsulfatase A-like enzyme
MIWNQPGRIQSNTVDAMVSSYDLFPTILDYLGVTAPPKDPKRVGMSYADFVRGKSPRDWRDRLFFEYAYVRCVRTRNLKYIERVKEWPSELFDLEVDAGETKNVIDDPAYADRLRALRTSLRNFFDKVGAPPLENWKSTTKQHLPVRDRAIRGGDD